MDILAFLHYFISFYSFALLCYLPYTDRLKRNKRRIIVESTLACIFLAALPSLLDNADYSQADQIVSILFYFAFFFYYKKTVQDGSQKLLFMTFIAVHMLCMGTELEFAIATLAGAFPLASPTPAAWYALFVPMRIALYLVVGFIVHRAFTPRLREIKAKDMKGLVVLPIVFASISIYRGADYYYKGTLDSLYPFIFLLLAVASFFVYWQMLRMLDSVTKNARLEAEAQRLDLEKQMREQALVAENVALERLNAMKTDLMNTISHETRTPLAVISSYTELIAMELRELGVNEQHAKDLDKVSREIQHIGQLMEEMQSLSRLRNEDAEKSAVNLADLISQTAGLYRHILERRDTSLTVELPDALPPVYLNPGELSQVLYNLLQNARNHTRGGGVTVKAGTVNDGKQIEITVADTGEGIAADLLPLVFERGATGRDGGTGLGLAVCKEIIASYNGDITIESEPDKGTTVRFTLPVYKGE